MSEERNKGRGGRGEPPPPDTDLDAIAEVLDDLDFGGQSESLAPPLGAPPPLPPPPEFSGDDDVVSSAPRPVRTPTRATTIPPPVADLPSGPTDDEVFGSELDAELEDVFAAIGAPPSKPATLPPSGPVPRPLVPPSSGPVPAPVRRAEFSESTRIAEVGDDLLRQSREEPRRPAVVRRDQLPRASGQRDVVAPPDEPGPGEATQIADLVPLRELSHRPEATTEPPPVALDESFYDDIEIQTGTQTPPPEAPAASLPRRVTITRNVVRRDRGSQPAIPVAARAERSGPQPSTRESGSQPRIPFERPVSDEPLGDSPILDDLFADEPTGTPPAGQADHDLGEGSGDLPLRHASQMQAVDPGLVPIADDDDYESFAQDAEPADDLSAFGTDTPPPEAWADALERARVDSEGEPEIAVDDGPTPEAVGDDADDATYGEAEPPSDDEAEDDVRTVSVDVLPARRERTPIPASTPVRLELPLPRHGLAAGAPARARAPEVATSDERRTRLLDEVEEARRLELPPRELARVLTAAGEACAAADDLDFAGDFFDEAVHVAPEYLPGLRAHRRYLVRVGQLAAAARLLEVEIALAGPDERAALAALRGELLVAAGEQDLARVAFGELSDARPDDVRSLFAQLELAYADERDDELATLVERVQPHVRDPQLVGALATLAGRLAERQGRWEAAETAFRAALDGPAAERVAAWGLTRVALAQGKLGDAAALIPREIAGVADTVIETAALRGRILTALAAGDATQAIEAAEQASTLDDALVLEAMAEAYSWSARRGETVLALQAWADAEPAPARRAEVLRRLAALHATPAPEHDDQAPDTSADLEVTLAQLTDADPGDTDAHRELALRRLARGDVDGALAAVPATAADDPGAAIEAARLYERAGRIDDALTVLEGARQGAGDSATAAELVTGLLARAGRHETLTRVLAEGAPDWRDPAAAAERAAWAADAWARDAEDPAAAEAADGAWQRLLALDATAESAHQARIAAGRARAAQVDEEGQRDLGPLLEALGQVVAATRDPERLAAVAVDQAALLVRSGAEPAVAAAPLERVLGTAPGDARATELLGALAAARGEPAEAAARWLERAELIGTSPGADALRSRAAGTLLEAGEAGRALELAQALLARRPRFAGAVLAAERAALAAGDVAARSALAESELAAEGEGAQPLRPAQLVRAGELHERSGEAGRAATRFRQALELRAGDPLARAGFARVAASAGALASFADLTLAELRQAEEDGDDAGRLAAYEQLAYVDGDLRGDRASATLAWEAVLGLAPGHASALRTLERTYLEEKQDAELALLYAHLGGALGEVAPADVVPVLHLKARLEERRGEPAAALADLRRIAELAPDDRTALFRLEARARETGNEDELTRWEEAIAAHFTGDARAQAAFWTRAAEAYADVARHRRDSAPADAARAVDLAAERFRSAARAVPGFFPALRGWLRLALAEGRWAEVATACEQMAESARSDAERARLYHLAGVTAMDRAEDAERAISDLRHVLALDPRHDDAFKRLRRLLTAHARHADLAELLTARVEIETDGARVVELHGTLAALYRDALGDHERAKAHLRALLTRDGKNLPALAALSDLTWGHGQWSEAAEALIARARLEQEPAALKETFFRLGVIYTDHLPDRRWAMKSFERVLQLDAGDVRALEYLSNLAVAGGEWRLALGATERLVGLLPAGPQRTHQLHRIARIHEEGFGDQRHAEEALRRAQEQDPTNVEALLALVELYRRRRDPATLRVHLDRAAGTMRWRLTREPFEGAAYHVLARALVIRGQLGVAGSVDAARAAAELAQVFGAADDADIALVAEAGPPSVRGLGDLAVDDLLFHPSIPNGFRQIFHLLYDTLGKRFPADLRRFGVGRQDRLPRGGHPLRDLCAGVAGELGIKDVDVYVSAAQPVQLAVELTEPFSLILGARLVDASKPAQIRFAAARALKLAASYMSLPARLTADELGVLLAGIIRQYDHTFLPGGLSAGAIAEEAQRLSRLIPKRLRDEVAPFASEISGPDFDHLALWLGVQHTGNRAGLLAAGSVTAALQVLQTRDGAADLLAAREDPQVLELLRFAVSDEHAELRRTLPS